MCRARLWRRSAADMKATICASPPERNVSVMRSSGWARGSIAPMKKTKKKALPQIVSQKAWQAAHEKLLEKEKVATRKRDALAAERRRQPMVEIEKEYVFEGPDGKASLLDLFEGRRQLIVDHFMFDPSWDDGCPSCTAGADEISKGHLEHLHARDTTFAYVSRAPLAKIEAYKKRRGWTFPWYSSFGSDFNYDFHVTLDESVTPVEYNYRTKAEYEQRGEAGFIVPGESSEQPGQSC